MRSRTTLLSLKDIRFWGRRFADGYPVPIFVSMADNRAVDDAAEAVRKYRTRRRYRRKNRNNRCD